MIRTILWPTDLSKNSLKSAKHVVSLAEKYQAKIIMLYVATDLTSLYGGYAHSPGEHHLKHFQEWELKQAKSKMQQICETELKACPNMEIRLVQGTPPAKFSRRSRQKRPTWWSLPPMASAMTKSTRKARSSAAWRKKSFALPRCRYTWSIRSSNNHPAWK